MDDIEDIVLNKKYSAQKLHFYINKQGYKVFTSFSHRSRGQCCGNKCLHCPFDHKNVSEHDHSNCIESIVATESE